MRIFISQPLFEKKTREILDERQKNLELLWKCYGKNIEIIDNFKEFSHDLNHIDFLIKNLKKMESSDLVYFSKDWECSKICQIEHQYAILYNLEIKEETKNFQRKIKGILNITYNENKYFVKGINCNMDMFFYFTKFHPIIFDSKQLKDKSICFNIAVLDKYENILLSEEFKKYCSKNNVSLQIDTENISIIKKHENALLEIFKGQEVFKTIIN